MKFYQTLNQAPRSAKQNGKHRRASPKVHSRPVVGADFGAGGSDTTVYTFSYTGGFTFYSGTFSRSQPKPPAVPYAGIRTGELIGYRMWWVIEDRLCSLAHRQLWEPGQIMSGDIGKPVDNDPFDPIFGGVYVFSDIEQLKADRAQSLDYIAKRSADNDHIWVMWGWDSFAESKTIVTGTVKLWGEVVEHQRGYRAEFAKINSLDEIHGPGDLDALRKLYGVS